MKILANDGISSAGAEKLEKAGFHIRTEKVNQEDLIDFINKENYDVLLVRSATTVRKDIIDACPGLKFVGRGGVGMDNIDVEYARSKGITVANTPASSSQSVAELVMAHMFSLARMTYDANREMPTNGVKEFKSLKKKYGAGSELRGKTLGIIGFGRIGQSLASYALGCGMRVIFFNRSTKDGNVTLNIFGMDSIDVKVEQVSMETILRESDVISLHIPKQSDGKAVIDKAEFEQMKKGVYIVNAARGGVINEKALMDALDSGKVAGAALDVFDNEPTPSEEVLKHKKIALSPHIGAATDEAQDRIGEELADLIIAEFQK